ncbi:zinc finger CCCH domain-containing protein 19-like [Chenopodium quinoa]|uniref:zinc finger CCCH domain-containing protein 19-like n=1 Tax=Chenopodium quinoa TaxID=63459 RepID=UPI000B774AD6|nr:zinc finger CCCH domain-containing protein 19-like [Chenopodium quinoa]
MSGRKSHENGPFLPGPALDQGRVSVGGEVGGEEGEEEEEEVGGEEAKKEFQVLGGEGVEEVEKAEEVMGEQEGGKAEKAEEIMGEQVGGEEVEKADVVMGEQEGGEEVENVEEVMGEQEGGEEVEKAEEVVGEQEVGVEAENAEEVMGEQEGGVEAENVEEVMGEQEGGVEAQKAEEFMGKQEGGEEAEKLEEVAGDKGCMEVDKVEVSMGVKGGEVADKLEEFEGEKGVERADKGEEVGGEKGGDEADKVDEFGGEKGGEEADKVDEFVGEVVGEEATKLKEDVRKEGGEVDNKMKEDVKEEEGEEANKVGEDVREGGEEASAVVEEGGEEANKVEEDVRGGEEALVVVGEGGGEEANKVEEGEEANKVEEDVREGGEEVMAVMGEEGDEADKVEVDVKEGGGEEASQVVGEGGEETDKTEEDAREGSGEMEDSPFMAKGVEEADKTEEDVREGGEIEDSSVVAEDEELMKGEETPIADAEMEVEKPGSGSGSGGKRRRGRNSKATTPTKAPVRKTVGEDVCFVCLDGGDLVLCDRRGCPKAYHPSCVDHDEEFFQSKGKWNCGWHLCNQCGKNAYFLCYTCTFSLCKGCSKDAAIFCVRGTKGFCESCMKAVTMIENSEQNTMSHAAFDDKSSWEYLFKDYWIEQKGKLGITSDELAKAKNPWKNSDATNRRRTPAELLEGSNDVGTDSDSSPPNVEVTDLRRKRAKRKSKPEDSGTDSSSEKETGTVKRKSKRRLKSQAKETYSDSEHSSGNQGSKRGSRARRLAKSRSKGGGSATAEGNIEWASKELLEFVMHMKNGDSSVLTQFDVQGLLLEYIKINKLRDPRRQSQILCDSMLQKLFGKARVGHFEMLKLLESHFFLKEDARADDNHESVIDTEVSHYDVDDHTDPLWGSGKSKGKKSRKRGEERGQSNLDDYAAIDMHNINLIYLRRSVMEPLMDDPVTFHDKIVGSFVRIRISGSSQKQDIYRLVQIIGTNKAPESYKVGKRTTDVMLEILNLDKTEIVPIDTISNQEFTEDECKRLRQSIKCGLISRMTVGDILEKARELQEVRVTDWLEAEVVRLSHLRDRASETGRKKELRECVEKLQLLKTPEERQRRLNEVPEVHADPKMDPSCESDDEIEHDKRQASNMRPRESGHFRRGRDHYSSRSANARPPNKSWEPGRNLSSKGFSNRRDDTTLSPQRSEHTWNNGVDKGTPKSNSWEKPRSIPDSLMSNRAEHSGIRSDLSVAAASEPTLPLSSAAVQTDGQIDEKEKMWHYRDPTGKVQGPFSMTQLRKWSSTGYFPAELRIWRASLTEDDSILLTEALAGKFQKDPHPVGSNLDVSSNIRNTLPITDASKLSGSRYDSSNLPSPTPGRSPAAWSGMQTSSSFQSTNQFRGNERLPSPTPTSPASNPSGVDKAKFSQQSKGEVAGNKPENVAAPMGTVQHAPVQFVSNTGMVNAQQMSSQAGLHAAANQPFVPSDTTMNQTKVGPNALGAGQGFSNIVQPGTGQNPPVYTHNWGAGYVARPEMVNANVSTSNNQNALPAQVSYSQWTGAAVNNQPPPYAAGYPPGQGIIAANFPAMPANNAWRPTQANMPWGAQQQQPVNQNVGWSGQPAVAMGQQLTSPSPGAPAMVAAQPTVGWTGTGPNPSAGNSNMVWVAAPGNTGAWGGDQNRNDGGARDNRNDGGTQWNRQSSFGSGGQRGVCRFHENGHCRKGSSCDFMHS